MWSTDVKLAYPQSVILLQRCVFIRNPADEFELAPDERLELLKPLYGLSDFGDKWHSTLCEHLISLGLTPSKADPSLMFKHNSEHQLIGIYGSYVDDLLRAGDNEFVQLYKKTRRRLVISEDKELTLMSAGYNISRSTAHPICIDRSFYVENLKELIP